MEIHQKISRPDFQKLKTTVKRRKDQKLRLRNFDARNERIETGAVVTNRRVNVVLKEDKENATNGMQKDSVREETNAVSGSVQNQHQKPLHPLSHQHKEVQVRRGKGTPEAGVHLESPIDSRAETSYKVICIKLPCDYWHPPECHFCKSESGCAFGNKCSFPYRKVEEQPSKKLKKDGDKSAVAFFLKALRQLGCVFQDTAPPEFLSILRKGTKVSGPIRRVRFTKATQRHADIRENKGPSLENTGQTSSSAQSLRSEI